MRYRNMKSGIEREFPKGIKFDESMWKPVQRFRAGGRATVQITEIHPEDVKPDMEKSIMGEDKAPEKKSRRKSSLKKAVDAARRKEAKAQEAEIVEESA